MKKAHLLLIAFFAISSSLTAQHVRINNNEFRNSARLVQTPKTDGELFEVDNICYRVIDEANLEVEVVAKEFPITYEGTIIIPDVVEYNEKTYKITTIDEMAFSDCYSLKVIEFGKNITTIEDQAFHYCENLTDLVIPDNVISIGKQSFKHCIRIENIAIGKGLQHFGKDAFYDIFYLKNITVSPENEHFCDIDGVLFNKDVTTLYYRPANVGATSYTVPVTVKRIASYSFIYSDLLQSLELPNGLEVIEEGAFAYCKNLLSIHIPASVEEIGYHFLRDTWVLGEIIVDEQSSHFSSEDGVLFDKAKQKLLYHPANRDITNYIIPESVTIIENFAFMGSKKLERITTPPMLKEIGRRSFDDCKMLHEIEFFDALEKVAASSFSGCDTLRRVSFGNNVKTIGEYVFYPCRNLEEVTIKSETPPVAELDAFYNVGNCLLRVPVGSIGAYQSDQEWSTFSNIVEVDFTGIDNLSIADEVRINYNNNVLTIVCDNETEVELYNLSGQILLKKRVSGNFSKTIEPGIYLISTNGRAKKVLLK